MKKIIALVYALVLGFSLTVFAADTASTTKQNEAKLNEAKELRVESVKASMQAESLLKHAIEIEREIVVAESKNGEKMRGGLGASSCVGDCLGRHGDLYTCRRACGAY